MVAEDSLDSFKIDSLNPNPNLKDAVFLLDKVKSIILPIDHTLVEYESLKSQVASLNETLSHATENLAKAVSDLESATLQMNTMENQHATLVNELEMKLSQSQTALTECNATKNKVVASLQQSNEEVQSLRHIIEKQNLEISAKNVVIIHQDADLAALQSSNLSLLTMLKSQEATGHDLERVLANKETEIQRINKEKEEALMANASINGELEAVKGKMNALQSDHELTKVALGEKINEVEQVQKINSILQVENEDKVQLITELEAQIDTLQSAVKRSQTTALDYEAKIAELNHRYAQIQARCDLLEKDCRGKMEQIEDLSNLLDESNAERHDIERTYQNLKEEMQQLNTTTAEKIQDISCQIDSRDTKIQEISENLDACLAAQMEYQHEISVLQEIMDRLKKENADLVLEKSRNLSDYESVVATLEPLKLQLTELQHYVSELEMQKIQQTDQINALSSELSGVSAENTSLKSNYDAYLGRNKELRRSLENAKSSNIDYEKKLDEANVTISDLDSALCQTKLMTNILEKQITDSDNMAKSLRQEIGAKNRQILALSEKLSMLEGRYSAKGDELRKYNQIFKRIANQRDALLLVLQYMDRQCSQCSMSLRALCNEFENAKSSLLAKDDALASVQRMNGDLQKELDDIRKMNINLLDEVKDVEQKFKMSEALLKDDADAMKVEMESLKSSNIRLNEENQKSLQKVKLLTSELEELQSMNISLSCDRAAFEIEVAELKTYLESETDRLKSVNSNLIDRKELVEEKLESLKEENERLKDEVEKLQEEIALTETTVNSVRAELNLTTESLRSSQAESSKLKSTFTKRNAELQELLNDLNQAVATKEQTIKDLRAQLKASESIKPNFSPGHCTTLKRKLSARSKNLARDVQSEIVPVKIRRTESAYVSKSSVSAVNLQKRTCSVPHSKSSADRKHEAKVVVTFSGFREVAPVYNWELRDSLAEAILKLGGSVKLENDEFDIEITHVITPPNSRTLKTLAAALTHRWLILDYNWITESAKCGKFISPETYGVQYKSSPFKDKQVYITQSFLDENKGDRQFRIDNANSLIVTFGSGIITNSLEDASWVLRATSDKTAYPVPSLDWLAFVKVILPDSKSKVKK